jgi:hypothetical protein
VKEVSLKKVFIAIPLYKPFEAISAWERASLQQCYRILNKHEVVFTGPPELDYEPYLAVAASHNVQARVVHFKARYFKNISGYNRLLMSPGFYGKFLDYEFMLIYQPDCWVFRDELDSWCEKGFDYIGAPWFEGFALPREDDPIVGVGNGGLSLRRVRSLYRITRSFSFVQRPEAIWSAVVTRVPWLMKPVGLLRFLLNLTIRNNTFYWFNTYTGQEDGFWGLIVPRNFSWYRLADESAALAFSFEAAPRRLYLRNNNRLPFGCHAWDRYETEFWRPFISALQS